MKKAIGFLAACAMVGALALGVVACEGDKGTDETTHVHAWGEWTTVTAATLFEDGKEERVCSEDATHKEDRTVDALPLPDAKTVLLVRDDQGQVLVIDFFLRYYPADYKA